MTDLLDLFGDMIMITTFGMMVVWVPLLYWFLDRPNRQQDEEEE